MVRVGTWDKDRIRVRVGAGQEIELKRIMEDNRRQDKGYGELKKPGW